MRFLLKNLDFLLKNVDFLFKMLILPSPSGRTTAWAGASSGPPPPPPRGPSGWRLDACCWTRRHGSRTYSQQDADREHVSKRTTETSSVLGKQDSYQVSE